MGKAIASYNFQVMPFSAWLTFVLLLLAQVPKAKRGRSVCAVGNAVCGWMLAAWCSSIRTHRGTGLSSNFKSYIQDLFTLITQPP